LQLKDLIAGREAAKDIADRAAWVEQRPAQVSVPEADLVAEVRKILAQYEG
jgi:histidyl-tRNA synthetase